MGSRALRIHTPIGNRKQTHPTPPRTHMGKNMTCQKFKLYVDWPGMKKDVEEYIKKYVSCQKNKITQISTKLPLQLTTTPHSVMQKMHSEVVGTITISSKQNRRVHLNNGGRADMVSGCSACERENR